MAVVKVLSTACATLTQPAGTTMYKGFVGCGKTLQMLHHAMKRHCASDIGLKMLQTAQHYFKDNGYYNNALGAAKNLSIPI